MVMYRAALIILFFSLPAIAQVQDLPDKTIKEINENKISEQAIKKQKVRSKKFAAVVQHIKGKARKKSSKDHLKFKDIIAAGESVKVGKNSILKIVSNSRCVGVIYGPAKFKAPDPDASALDIAWDFSNGSIRWICQSGQRELVKVDDLNISVTGGEFIYDDNQLLVLADAVSANGQNLSEKTLYGVSLGKLLAITPKAKTEDVWKFDQTLLKPKESHKLAKKDDSGELDPVTSRWILGAHIGAASITPSEQEFTNDSLEIFGFRPQFHYKISSDASLIGSFGFQEMDSGGDDNFFSMFPTTESRISEMFFADIGYRFRHHSKWSFFIRLGIAEAVWSVSGPDPLFPMNFIEDEVDFMIVYANIGIDRTYRFSNTFGFYFSIELQYGLSISSDSNSSGQSGSSLLVEDGDITTMAVFLSLGPMLTF